MARVKIHYEGWVALPSDMRRSLGLEVGGELVAELADGAIVLRPTERADVRGSTEPGRAEVAATAAVAEAGPSPDQVMPPAKRRGRPPKAAPET